jgi:hypothetical protein
MARADNELAILRRVVGASRRKLSRDAAKAILKLGFSAKDRRRINVLAAKNRAGLLSETQEREFSSYIRVGQTLGILHSNARQALRK